MNIDDDFNKHDYEQQSALSITISWIRETWDNNRHVRRFIKGAGLLVGVVGLAVLFSKFEWIIGLAAIIALAYLLGVMWETVTKDG